MTSIQIKKDEEKLKQKKIKFIRSRLMDNNFAETIELCTKFESECPQNYIVTVFKGKAFSGLNDNKTAIQIYNCAIEMQPTSTQAYQGLQKAYEIRALPCEYDELIKVYNKILTIIDDDKDRICEKILRNLFVVETNKGALLSAITSYNRMVKAGWTDHANLFKLYLLTRKQNIEKNASICLELMYSDVPDEHDILVGDLVKYTLADDCSAEILLDLDKHVEHMFDNKSEASLMWKLYRVLVNFNLGCQSSASYEVLFGFLGEYEHLFKVYFAIDKLVTLFRSHEEDDFASTLNIIPQLSFETSLLKSQMEMLSIDCNFKRGHHDKALQQIENFSFGHPQLKDIQTKETAFLLKYTKMMCLFHLKDFHQSLQIYSEIKGQQFWKEDITNFVTIGSMYIELKDEQFTSFMNSASPEIRSSRKYKFLLALNHFKIGELEISKQLCLEISQDSEPGVHPEKCLLARIAFAMCPNPTDNTKLMSIFKEALTSTAFEPEVRLDYVKYLSLFKDRYDNEIIDILLSITNLDVTNIEASKLLIDNLLRMNKIGDAKNYLSKVLTYNKTNMNWAHCRYARIHEKCDDHIMAIGCMQKALMYNDTDSVLWDSLGDLYIKRGSMGSALKAYKMSSNLNPDGKYSFYMIASVKHQLGAYGNARNVYMALLARDPVYVLALNGLAETYLKLAEQSLQVFFDGLCRQYCEEALKLCDRLLDINPEYTVAWKNAGDACVLASKLGGKQLSIPQKFIGSSSPQAEILLVAETCFTTAANLRDSSACNWLYHDVAYVKLLAARRCVDPRDPRDPGDPEIRRRRRRLLSEAEALCKHAVALCPRLPANHWNTLGLIYIEMHKYSWALHCFIKATVLYNQCYEAWCNIASLYVLLGKYELANQVYDHVVCLKPEYVNTWIGKAFLHRAQNNDIHSDIMKHAATLCQHPVSEYWHANFELKRMLKGDLLSDQEITIVLDCLERYNVRNPNDISMLIAYGSTLEVRKNFRHASTIYLRAKDALVDKEDDKSLINELTLAYARCLSKSGNHSKAYTAVKSLEGILTIKQRIDFALIAFNAADYKTSASIYNGAYTLLEDGEHQMKEELTLCIALCKYKQLDCDSAKRLILHCMDQPNAAVQCYTMMCAVCIVSGVSSGELDNGTGRLIRTILDRLGSCLRSSKTTARDLDDYSYLAAYYYKLAKDPVSVCRFLQRKVIESPYNSTPWKILARYIFSLGQDFRMCKLVRNSAMFAQALQDPTEKDQGLLLILSNMCCGLLNGYKNLIKFQIRNPNFGLHKMRDLIYLCQYSKAIENSSDSPIAGNVTVEGQSKAAMQWNNTLDVFNAYRMGKKNGSSLLDKTLKIYPDSKILLAFKSEKLIDSSQSNLVFLTQLQRHDIDVVNKKQAQTDELKLYSELTKNNFVNASLKTLFLMHMTKSEDKAAIDKVYKEIAATDPLNAALFMIQADIFHHQRNVRGERYCLQASMDRLLSQYFESELLFDLRRRLITIHHQKKDELSLVTLLERCKSPQLIKYSESIAGIM